MKAEGLMDKQFIYVSKEDNVVEVSKLMEKVRRFTCPVLNDDMKLVGWVTSFEITKGLREGKEKIQEIMSPFDDIVTVNANDPARVPVIEFSNNKFVSIPVVNDDNQVIGVIRACDIVHIFSDLYDIKVVKLYDAMKDQLKGVTWDELMEASAVVSRRTTGEKISPEKYEENINKTTFGEAIWATGGLENFFAGLIAVGELVTARKIGRAKR